MHETQRQTWRGLIQEGPVAAQVRPAAPTLPELLFGDVLPGYVEGLQGTCVDMKVAQLCIHDALLPL